METRFDPDKDAINRAKHGLSLAFGYEIAADPGHAILPTIREEDGERRFRLIGEVAGKLYTGVFVWRDGAYRFVSVRRSNESEERSYRSGRRP